MAEKKYTVDAPMVFVRVGEGSQARAVTAFYGQELPAGVSADELKRLTDEGFVKSGESDGGVVFAEQPPASRKA